jgi:hypothetical protein
VNSTKTSNAWSFAVILTSAANEGGDLTEFVCPAKMNRPNAFAEKVLTKIKIHSGNEIRTAAFVSCFPNKL